MKSHTAHFERIDKVFGYVAPAASAAASRVVGMVAGKAATSGAGRSGAAPAASRALGQAVGQKVGDATVEQLASNKKMEDPSDPSAEPESGSTLGPARSKVSGATFASTSMVKRGNEPLNDVEDIRFAETSRFTSEEKKLSDVEKKQPGGEAPKISKAKQKLLDIKSGKKKQWNDPDDPWNVFDRLRECDATIERFGRKQEPKGPNSLSERHKRLQEGIKKGIYRRNDTTGTVQRKTDAGWTNMSPTDFLSQETTE